MPLVITHEGQYPEEVAYGPQILMDRLGKWLRKYFDHVVASKAHPSPTAQADSQPAPEYVGNGMFKGETIEKAAEHWANWCDVRCMTGLSEFLRVVASRVQADSVQEDAARWQMAVLVGNEVLMHPDKRSNPSAVKAYMDAVHSGLDLTGAVDAARKQGENHE